MAFDPTQTRRDTVEEIVEWVCDYGRDHRRTPPAMVLALMNAAIAMVVIGSNEDRTLASLYAFKGLVDTVFDDAIEAAEKHKPRMQ